MTDITIIIPVHKFNEQIQQFLINSLHNIEECRKEYTYGKLYIEIVGPKNVLDNITKNKINSEDLYLCENKGKTDFCSQINNGVNKIQTEYFSILEFDDIYTEKWFKMAHDYFYTNESVSVFLPINILTDADNKHFQYVNEVAWTSAFSNELGYLDFDCLQDYPSFNLTGGIFNTNDFKAIGGLKPSIKVAFNYEFLLRLTKKDLKVFVVPKEGYIHTIGRTDSLTDEYNNTFGKEDIKKWFDLAKTEYVFIEDRGTNIDKVKTEILK